MPIIAKNKRAYYDYEILEEYESGLVLFGHEVKSIKSGHISLKGSFVSIRQGEKGVELFLVKAFVSLYKKASQVDDYNPERDRKLLLRKNEINRLFGKTQEKGLTLVPLKMYTKHSFIKLGFALAKGKKKYDKRDSIKKREEERKIRTLTKENIRY